jgi:hypothetical protein
MSSRMFPSFTKFSGLFLPKNSIIKRIPMRYNTTNQPSNPTSNANQANSSNSAATLNPAAKAPSSGSGKDAPGKGKGIEIILYLLTTCLTRHNKS